VPLQRCVRRDSDFSQSSVRLATEAGLQSTGKQSVQALCASKTSMRTIGRSISIPPTFRGHPHFHPLAPLREGIAYKRALRQKCSVPGKGNLAIP